MWAKKLRVLSWPWKNLWWKLDGFLWVKNEIPEWSGKNIYLTPLGWCYPVCARGSQHSACIGVGLGTATTSQLVSSPLHACVCVHTYLCGSRRFQRTLSVFPSVWWPRPNTFDWNVTPRGNSGTAPPRSSSTFLTLTVHRSAAGSQRLQSVHAHLLSGWQHPGCTVT